MILIFVFTSTVTSLRLTNTKVSIIAIFILNRGCEYRVVYRCTLLLFHYFIFITILSSPSELLHCFNTHSRIHDKLVLIAGATLLHFFNFHCLFIFPIKEHKGKIYCTTVPSHYMSSSYSHYTCLFFGRYTTA